MFSLLSIGCGSRGFAVRAAHEAPSGENSAVTLARKINDQYSRNAIVCTPTMIGNFVGMIAGSPFFLIGKGANSLGLERTAIGFGVMGNIPIYVVGGALGTPFLPFSYIAREKPCEHKLH